MQNLPGRLRRLEAQAAARCPRARARGHFWLWDDETDLLTCHETGEQVPVAQFRPRDGDQLTRPLRRGHSDEPGGGVEWWHRRDGDWFVSRLIGILADEL